MNALKMRCEKTGCETVFASQSPSSRSREIASGQRALAPPEHRSVLLHRCAMRHSDGRHKIAGNRLDGERRARTLVGESVITSYTPNTWPFSLGRMGAGVIYGLQGFGASASAHCRSRRINLEHTFVHTGRRLTSSG
jgi:hypothetical protein